MQVVSKLCAVDDKEDSGSQYETTSPMDTGT